MWTALEDFIVALFEGHRISNSPPTNTVSHFKIVPLWLFYLLHVSFTENSAVHRLRRKVFHCVRSELSKSRSERLVAWKRHVSFAHKISRPMPGSSKPRHSALNKWWIYGKNDCLPLAKNLSLHYSFQKGVSHTRISAFKAFFNTKQEVAYDVR